MQKISFPPILTPAFSTTLRVRVYDLNYGNHLGNDSLLSLVHEARIQFLAQYGYTELNIDGIGILITSMAVNYRAEAFYGDDITIKIGIGEITKTSMDIYYELIFEKTQKVVANVVTTITCYNYTLAKVTKVPETFLDRMKPFSIIASH